MSTLLDLSRIEELKPLARLVRAVKRSSHNLPFVLAGAQARDLLLKHAHGIATGRQTADVDFAFRVDSWNQFSELRKRLLESGEFVSTKTLHKLKFKNSLEIDIVPFGGIERPDRTIEWPPDGDHVMSLFGFQEVSTSTIRICLPDSEEAASVSLHALALLKFAAWRDRRVTHPGKDAYDLRLIIKHYIDAGNSERLYSEFAELVAEDDFDYDLAGAFVLGRDIAGLLDSVGRTWLLDLLARETDEAGQLLLVGDLKIDAKTGRELLRSVLKGAASCYARRNLGATGA